MIDLSSLKSVIYCDRVRGFWYGYHFQSGSHADLHNAEFTKGWQEGADLLFDERRAFKARLDASKIRKP